jgi:hypothetical protein
MEKDIFRELADVLCGGGGGGGGGGLNRHMEIEGAGHALQKTHCIQIASAMDEWMASLAAHDDHHQK